MDEAQKHYAKLKRSDSKGYVLYDSIYMTIFKRQIIGKENRSVVARLLDRKRGWLQRSTRELFGVMVYILIVAK